MQDPKKRRKIIIIIVALAAVLISTAAYFIQKNHNSEENVRTSSMEVYEEKENIRQGPLTSSDPQYLEPTSTSSDIGIAPDYASIMDRMEAERITKMAEKAAVVIKDPSEWTVTDPADGKDVKLDAKTQNKIERVLTTLAEGKEAEGAEVVRIRTESAPAEYDPAYLEYKNDIMVRVGDSLYAEVILYLPSESHKDTFVDAKELPTEDMEGYKELSEESVVSGSDTANYSHEKAAELAETMVDRVMSGKLEADNTLALLNQAMKEAGRPSDAKDFEELEKNCIATFENAKLPGYIAFYADEEGKITDAGLVLDGNSILVVKQEQAVIASMDTGETYEQEKVKTYGKIIEG